MKDFKKIEKQKFEAPIPIILGGFVNGLGIARSFGQENIPTICLDTRKNITYYSKYALGLICPDPVNEEKRFIEYLVELGKSLKNKGVFFATNDIWLFPICKNRDTLEKYYLYPMSTYDIIEKCLDKSYLYKIADENNIPYPKTHSISSIGEIDNYLNQIVFPCILKPAITVGFMEKLGINRRTIIIDDASELKFWKNEFLRKGLDETPIIIQEQIVGPTENLYTLTSYSNTEGNIVAYSTGHKIRQNPPDAGTILSGKVKKEPDVYKSGQKLIKALKFYGIANTEFKKDEKDGIFKLIEINPRPGMWNYSVLKSGVNLPYIAYSEIIGVKKYSEIKESDEGKVWILLLSDFICALYSFRKKGYVEYSCSLTQWIKSISGKKIYAIESVDDVIPSLIYNTKFVLSVLLSIFKRE